MPKFLSRAAMLTLLALAPAATLAQAGDPAPGQWGKRAPLIEANSEFTLASTGGRIYVLGGYPRGRVSVRTVQIYDIAADRWELGPPLPEVNNHGMAASLDGVIYLFGGQIDPMTAYIDTVYALDTRQGAAARGVEKSRMPTKRSAGVAIVHAGKIYVVGGRPPRGHDFAVYDPATDNWETLPDLPSQRNHIAAELIAGRIHVFGGLLGVSGGLLQLNSKRCEPLNVPSLPCKYVFFYNGCTQHFSLLKLRRGAAVPARFYNSDSQYVRRRLALFFPRDARQRGRDP